MNKILIILKKEYLSRVKKKSFIIMTILGPILMASVIIAPIYIAQLSDEKHIIAVIDETRPDNSNVGIFKFPDTKDIKFEYLNTDIVTAKNNFKQSKYYAILWIPEKAINIPYLVRLYSLKETSLSVKLYIENIMRAQFRSLMLNNIGIDKKLLEKIDKETAFNIQTVKIDKEGSEFSTTPEISMAIGLFAGILIYFFIFLYGSQVMRSVIEEKTSRIVEIIVSSVKPFQLMMGKIIGVALVGLTQFALWILLTLAIVIFFKTANPDVFSYNKIKTEQAYLGGSKIPNINNIDQQIIQPNEAMKLVYALKQYNFVTIIIAFIFYFIGGYLLYGALFAAIGAAVDSETDTQQFMLPVTLPLILAIFMAQFVINNPGGPVAFWLSIIPFTSPIIMMIRLPFDVPYLYPGYLDLIISMLTLILGFIGATWLAAKIYRTGILMYGKKINYADLWKWIKD
ncbi:MAG TPA: ABC transporter permease [Bacteroidales bacterium]|nr:ABC transporter permease [Bacteroidales bacterium]